MPLIQAVPLCPNGITGETASTYTPPAQSNLWTSYVSSNLWWPYSDTLGPHAMTVHTDGTIFAGLATDVEVTYDDSSTGTATKFSVVAVDPATGSQKFQVLLPFSPNLATPPNEQDWDVTYPIAGPIVAGAIRDRCTFIAFLRQTQGQCRRTPPTTMNAILLSSAARYFFSSGPTRKCASSTGSILCPLPSLRPRAI